MPAWTGQCPFSGIILLGKTLALTRIWRFCPTVHDARVLRHSPLYQSAAYPPPGIYLLGDGGYPCLERPISLVTPYKNPLRGMAQQRLKYVISIAIQHLLVGVQKHLASFSNAVKNKLGRHFFWTPLTRKILTLSMCFLSPFSAPTQQLSGYRLQMDSRRTGSFPTVCVLWIGSMLTSDLHQTVALSITIINISILWSSWPL